MTVQQITTVKTEDLRNPLAEASLALGKAWGLATVCCHLLEGRGNQFGIEGVLGSVRHQLGEAADLVQDIAGPSLAVCEAVAVCGLVLADVQENTYSPDSPSMWALEALPDAISRAKEAADAALNNFS